MRFPELSKLPTNPAVASLPQEFDSYNNNDDKSPGYQAETQRIIETIAGHHLRDLRSSAISDDIIVLNFESCTGQYDGHSRLLYSPKIRRRNGGRVTDSTLKRYRHIENGGWWCSGIDLTTLESGLWGCFKPDTPRPVPDKPGKYIKYEHPWKEDTGLFAPRVPPELAQQILEKCGHSLDEAPSDCPNPFWWVVKNNPDVPIVITEGAKKAAALSSAGYVAIGLPGIWNFTTPETQGTDPDTLKPELKCLVQKGRPFYIAYDQDVNQDEPGRTDSAREKLGKLFESQGCKVKIIQWDKNEGKGCDDLIVNCGQDAFHQVYNKSIDFSVWTARRENQCTCASLTIHQRFIKKITIPEFVKLIGILSAKGTGKTEFISEEVRKQLVIGRKVLVLSHRIQLGKALCVRFGIPYVTDLPQSQRGESQSLGLCVDSLHEDSQAGFNVDEWDGAVVVVDEVVQVMWHMLHSKTCKKSRVKILKDFRTLIENASKVIIADADLNDAVVTHFSKLMKGVDPFVIENTYKLNRGEVYRYTEPEALVTQLINEVGDGGKVFISVTAQKKKSLWSTTTLEKRFKEGSPDKTVLRIDSESISDPNHPAYGIIPRLNEELQKYDIVIASPSIETGVSIDIKGHFTSVWVIAQGIQSESSVRQAIARVREPVPRHVYAASYGKIGQVGNGATKWKPLYKSLSYATKICWELLQKNRLSSEQSIWEVEAIDPMSDEQRLFAQLAAIHNAGMIGYDEQIFTGLREEGYQIIDVDSDKDEDKKTKEELRSVRDEGYAKKIEDIVTVEPLQSESEYQTIKDSHSKTETERNKERNWETKQRYGEVTPELVKLDDKGYYPKVRRGYDLSKGESFVPEKDRGAVESQIENGGLFALDFIKSQKNPQVTAFKALGVPKFLDFNRTFCNSDPDLIDLHKKATSSKAAGQLSIFDLGKFNTKQKPISVLRSLLDKLGYGLEEVSRGKRVNGKRERVYKLVDKFPHRERVYDYWLKKDEERRLAKLAKAKEKASLIEPDIQAKTSQPTSIESAPQIISALAASIIQKLTDIAKATPEFLEGAVKDFVDSKEWSQVGDEVWLNLDPHNPARRLITSWTWRTT
ncbi:plasmid replication protein, CyRepA1 family [Moorena sp. SIO3A5]|uniref:plasmid replication protein, CyRepA1 family n=1 Tax=Moorena sp. SIO3A5 TaxID=2607822 RepID=UPI00141D3E1C|nr:plasmid replication protein, CyRepA1 family [Moorena sp. SIO3A5]NEP70264.1 DUF3854 domain-containing protein [Moorena sp. SIO3A5]